MLATSDMLCSHLYSPNEDSTTKCPFGDRCRYMHDLQSFMNAKPPDISENCYLFKSYGKCPYGVACRYGAKHLTVDLKNIVNEDIYDSTRAKSTFNVLSKVLQEQLRKRTFEFVRSEAHLGRIKQPVSKETTDSTHVNNLQSAQLVEGVPAQEDCVAARCTVSEDVPLGGKTDEGVIKLRPDEKKKFDIRGKLYLAPLTTVGNLPFRRVCKELGADVTCGEMAMATKLLQGQQSEWALIKRHESEDLFGVQVCGAHIDTMTRCAELINSQANVDFVDINIGCPIDIVFKKGAGSALMGRATRFEGIVRGMTEVLDFPLTVKMRTGIYSKTSTAHKLIPKLRDGGVSLVTLHGRSREQRYTKMADWEYINSCALAASPMPLFGNGDILSFEDYNQQVAGGNIAGTMIARGALIKPWIFTEIKEQRHWDISSSERLDILRRYVNYGLEHWGSDTQGVENTRKFLMEWLSFLYRYIPVGVLETVPQRINERPPTFVGRDELETLMASSNCQDWIKISEILLGPVPQSFSFMPKHKANSYS
ncbi:tRNA-dihydrouridine(47) synthase [NAD(P)(+)]-like isoform X2 [Halichondria panicea]